MNQHFFYPGRPYCTCRQWVPQSFDVGGGQQFGQMPVQWPVNNLGIRDFGGKPFAINIDEAANQNNTFRTALWTGKHLQVTLMSIGVGEDVGLEVHPNVDQFLRLEAGEGLVQMGPEQHQLTFQRYVTDDDAIMVPAGTWHNLTNIGNEPIKLYSIYAPPEHPFGTIHRTKADDAGYGHP